MQTLSLPLSFEHNNIWFSYGHVTGEDVFDISKGYVPYIGVL